MKNKKGIRSPLFYVGDKYKLMPQLKELFPGVINNYYDVFCGGGSASINVKANHYYLNDIDSYVIKLHKWINRNSSEIELLIKKQYDLINKYNLSHSEFGLNTQIEKLKLEFKKTYFSKYNKENYFKLRDDFNNDQENMHLLYLLLVYGFNHMIRFNKNGLFNLPVGNVDWNKNVTKALKDYAIWVENSNEITYSSIDFEEFVNNFKIEEYDFLYFDPPYLITFSDYNKLWNETEEKRLYQLLDELDSKGIKWGLSNMLNHKGKENSLLSEWAQKYNEYSINSNYISRFDNSIKEDSKEIFVTNYSK